MYSFHCFPHSLPLLFDPWINRVDELDVGEGEVADLPVELALPLAADAHLGHLEGEMRIKKWRWNYGKSKGENSFMEKGHWKDDCRTVYTVIYSWKNNLVYNESLKMADLLLVYLYFVFLRLLSPLRCPPRPASAPSCRMRWGRAPASLGRRRGACAGKRSRRTFTSPIQTKS